MDEYTFKDLIINPETPGLRSLIGKEVYCSNVPLHCLNYANKNRSIGILKDVYKDADHPFRVETPEGNALWFSCIIPKKKEPKPEYAPFKSMEEFVEGYIEAKGGVKTDSFEDNLLQCGMWLKEKGVESGAYCMVTEIWKEGVSVGQEGIFLNEGSISTDFTSWHDLYLSFNFLDGTPCGRLMEEKHE